MSNDKKLRLIQVAKEFKVGMNTITDFLQKKGIKSDGSPNSPVESSIYEVLEKEFGANRSSRDERASVRERISQKQAYVSIESDDEKSTAAVSESPEQEVVIKSNVIEPNTTSAQFPKILGKIDLPTKSDKRHGGSKPQKAQNNSNKTKPQPKVETPAKPAAAPKAEVAKPKVEPKVEPVKETKPTPVAVEAPKVEVVASQDNTAESKTQQGIFRPTVHTLSGPNVLGTMDVSSFTPGGKHKRKRLGKEKVDISRQGANGAKQNG
ncbi:MAG: translation initiation factor IF-2, partial [Rikenellaceae bacterium]